ncbi:MAG: nucleotidyl transferase AbiEii/AbiGii toxin family protein [Clostridia bacterium]|nr:nucleotidyl transferase AbiEii/AbiGii toxin family protein [Clostridia bacterium]
MSESLPTLLFKGGTALSKCYKLIDRFSEDIDVTLTQDKITDGQRKKVKKSLLSVCDELSITLLNEADTRSRRDFNRYKIDYGPKYLGSITPILMVETTYIVKAYPHETKSVSSMICDYLVSTGQSNVIEEYDLQPFPLAVQTLDRTLVDKIFALCDYYLTGRIENHSRHIYDINKLVQCVPLDDKLATLFRDVRISRQESRGHCTSAQDEYSIPELLSEILEKETFKEDYDNVTMNILFKKVTYEEAIEGIRKLIDSGLFS